jgi:hypothetical protein
VKRAFIVLSTLVAIAFIAALAIARPSTIFRLDVPVVTRGPNRGGPASLAMVLGFYGADSTEQQRTDEAFNDKTGATSLKDLAATAIRLGYPTRVAVPGIDSLVTFLKSGVPPIVCVDPKPGVVAPSRYYLITQWDSLGNRFFARDGGPRLLEVTVPVLETAWHPGGGRALIVSRRRR